MKIIFVGNKDNNSYRMALWAKSLGNDVKLIIIHRFSKERSLPELIDPKIKENGKYPDWIIEYDPPMGDWWLQDHNFANYFNEHFDIAITTGSAGLFAANGINKIPVVHYNLGSEVTEHPLEAFSPNENLRVFQRSLFILRGLHKVQCILNCLTHSTQTLYQLGLESRNRLFCYPEDVENNARRIDVHYREMLLKKYSNFEKIFFWPNRIFLGTASNPEYKGADYFIEALHKLVSSLGYSLKPSKLKIIMGEHGQNIQEIKALLIKYNLISYIDFIPHLKFYELLTYFSLPNIIVFDDLCGSISAIGGVTREAASIGAPIVRSYDTTLIKLAYGDSCPIYNAQGIDGCFEGMKYFYNLNSILMEEYRQKTIQWSMQCLDYKRMMPKLIQIFEECIYFFRDRPKNKEPSVEEVRKNIKILSELSFKHFNNKESVKFEEVLTCASQLGFSIKHLRILWTKNG